MSPGDALPLARGEGVRFARSDCAGLMRRFLILMIDALVVLGVVGLAVVICQDVFEASLRQTRMVAWRALFVSGFVYLAVLKPTPLRTLGYRLFDVRIVTLRGERPSLVRMTWRLLLWAFGPFHPVIDWLWLGGDPSRQTLRDKIAGTLVVRSRATPHGRGRIGVAYYDLFTLSIPFLEVRRPAGIPADASLACAEPAPQAGATAGRQPRRAGRWLPMVVGVAYSVLAVAGLAWTLGGSWEMLLDGLPQSVVVNDGDRVLYADTASQAQARELAEILTDLGYFGGRSPAHVYVAVSGGVVEVSFFVPAYAWHDQQIIDYYQSLGAAIAERDLASRLHVTLRTPDWREVRSLEVD